MLRLARSGRSTLLRTSLLQTTLAGLLIVATGVATQGCEAPVSNESLNPEGPPRIRQVFVNEILEVEGGIFINDGLAFGSHSNVAFENDDGVVTTATALGSQEIRIILDELIDGTSMEEIECANDTWSRIPPGTTPDDIRDCTGDFDLILKRCTKVCIGDDLKPVGVLDEEPGSDGDGAADNYRMIDYNNDPNITELAVQVICDGVSIPLDQNGSFWSPSGNQTYPSAPGLGHRGLGPAIILKPVAETGMRTGANCVLKFNDRVVDKDGNTICAPTGGLITEDCSGNDVSKVTFQTVPLEVGVIVPDGTTTVARSDTFMLISFNANINEASLDAVTLTANGAPVTATVVPLVDDQKTVVVAIVGDFLPRSEYVLTVGTGVTDILGGVLAIEGSSTWTTGGIDMTSSIPADGAEGVATGSLVTLTFDGDLGDLTGALDLNTGGTAMAPDAVTPVPFTAAANGAVLEVTITGGMTAGAYYELAVDGMVLKDSNGGLVEESKLITWTALAL